MDKRVEGIVDAAARGTAPSREDVDLLLAFDAQTPEAAYVPSRPTLF